jgi:transposase
MAESRRPELTHGLLANSPDAFSIVASALHASGGSVEKAAKLLGVSRRTMFRWLASHRELRRARDEARGH